jgi:hypothetical protein
MVRSTVPHHWKCNLSMLHEKNHQIPCYIVAENNITFFLVLLRIKFLNHITSFVTYSNESAQYLKFSRVNVIIVL